MAGTVLAGQVLTSALLGMPAWSPMTFQNSWVNVGGGVVEGQYRLWPLINEYEVIGEIESGTITSATIIATLPTSPASAQYVCAMQANEFASSYVPFLYCDASGNLKIYNVPSDTTILSFHGWISMDA